MVTDGKVRPIRFYSKALTGLQLDWSAREKECYGIYYGVRIFEELLDNKYFVLKTDHKNLTYINVTFTGKVLRWKLYLQDKNFDLYHVAGKEMHQFVPDALSRLCVNNNPPPLTATESMLVVLRPAIHLDPETYRLIQEVHNGEVGHWGLHISKKLLRNNGHGRIPNRDIQAFIRQCPACQVMNRLKIPIKTHPFTCASYNPFEVLHLDHSGPLPVDSHGNAIIVSCTPASYN